ncbi:hypothetical protein SAMN05444487_10166 [Marininema mesophilum]|uniref:Uncharacterized protein n=1 Tax=Marininema mesophilum TaxID=1048340 RepID=A0A1H2Q1K1_9BACL|nr:hypothetical protein SAMN05444487_10166 [Marininema mesophilum]
MNNFLEWKRVSLDVRVFDQKGISARTKASSSSYLEGVFRGKLKCRSEGEPRSF